MPCAGGVRDFIFEIQAFTRVSYIFTVRATTTKKRMTRGWKLMHVTQDDAQKMITAARKAAVKTKTKMCIAVVDSGGNLKAFLRMDDAWTGSIDIAVKKAKTAVFFGMPTEEIGKLSQPGSPLYGIEHSNDGLITFPGGLPIVDSEGVLIGGIGVSGSSVENDFKVASAGLKVCGVCDVPDHPWRT